jgi:hypothetical protein
MRRQVQAGRRLIEEPANDSRTFHDTADRARVSRRLSPNSPECPRGMTAPDGIQLGIMCTSIRGTDRDGGHNARRARTASRPVVCPHCGGPIICGQQVGPLFSSKGRQMVAHPVLSQPPMLRGTILVDGSPGRIDLMLGDQVRQRAAMSGEKERVELAGSRPWWPNGSLMRCPSASQPDRCQRITSSVTG